MTVRFPLPWRALENALGGGLPPGVYALAGPIGSGKTQLALQIALGIGTSAAISASHVAPKELLARLEGIRTRSDWTDLDETKLEAPPSIEILGALPSTVAQMILVDPYFDDQAPVLTRARRLAIDEQKVTLLVVEPRSHEAVKSFVPREVHRRAPAEIAAWTGIAPNVAAEVDALLVLAPDRPRLSREWMSVDLCVAKNRRGIQGRAALRFNGLWFEDEPEKIDLELSDERGTSE
jgi:hypothetical protein